MLATAVLWIGAAIFVSVAVQGLFAPLRIWKPLGGSLETASVANEIRANYGGMHAGIALLLVLGSFSAELQRPALALLCVFCAGLVVGRIVSWVADGPPNRFLRVFLGLEAAGAVGAGLLLIF